MLESVRHDARHAARNLLRSPIFTATAVLSLAMGVGGTAAIFSLVKTLLLSAPPGISEPYRVVNVGRTQDGSGFDNFSYLTFTDLALLGVYGVTAYGVAQRTREIGIRIALGSSRREVLRLVLLQGIRLGGIGVAVGVAGVLIATRLLESMLYGVPGTDPMSIGAAAVLLLLAALLASWVPARRAARVDPMVALRTE